MDAAFAGAENLQLAATDAPNLAGLNSTAFMFANAASANPNISNWDTSQITDMSYMFAGATSFDRNIGSWDIASLQDATDMFLGVTLSTANYESLLIGWNAQGVQPNVTFNGGNSAFCSAAAYTAWDNLMASDGWTILDGGQDCPNCNLETVSGSIASVDTRHESCETLVIGPTYLAEDGAAVNLSSGELIGLMPEFFVESGAILDVKVCGQSLCEASEEPMPYGCHSCVDQICDIDPGCCGLVFDQACVDKVNSECGLTCE
jgi:surface protein